MNLFPIISSYIRIISPYILDITGIKGGLMVFVKSHMSSRRLNDLKIPSNMQIIPFEINLKKDKWLVASTLHLRKTNIFSGIFSEILLNLV